MSAAHPPDEPPTDNELSTRATQLRLLAAVIAGGAGVAALVIAILLLRSALA